MNKPISAPIAHLFALITITIWSTTYIASKVLLTAYSPMQIALMRFVLAYAMMWALRPKLMKLDFKAELQCALLGIFGCTLYFVGQNYALTYTLSSNVGILVATAPMITAVLAHFFLPDEKLKKTVFVGCLIALFGVALVSFNGTVVLKLNPVGDLLSIGAALSWAIYSILLKQHAAKYDSLLLTRRVLLWGFITSFPLSLLERTPFSLAPLADPSFLFSLLMLGLLGSGMCFVFWNIAMQRLGAVVVNNYIYISPFLTMLTAGLFLKEPISLMGVGGAALILIGVFITQYKKPVKAEAAVEAVPTSAE